MLLSNYSPVQRDTIVWGIFLRRDVMKKLLIVCIIGLLLTGCSKGIPQETFDNLDSEYSILQNKYDELLTEHNNLQNDIKELRLSYSALEVENNENKEMYSEYLTKYGELLAETVGDDILNAWGVTTFGSVESGLISNNSVQLVVTIDKATADNLKSISEQLFNGIETLVIVNTVDTKNLYIKVVDKTGVPIIEYSFLNISGDTEVKTMFSSDYLDIMN